MMDNFKMEKQMGKEYIPGEIIESNNLKDYGVRVFHFLEQ